jgi:cyclohexanone monooxygenase
MNTAQRSHNKADYDVIIVGAGFSGIYQLRKLRKLGLSVRLLDGGKDLGGIWYWNCYPGARVDSHVPIYGFSDETLWRDWDWSERYPEWRELRKYFAYVDKKWDIRKDVQFDCWVKAAVFDEELNLWTVTTEGGESLTARFVVLATGTSSPPYTPKIPGAETFTGAMHHTALWPQQGLSLDGKRVAVVGTGASGVQVIQEASKVARHLTVFQRTPSTCLPMNQASYTADMQAGLKKDYPTRFERRAHTFGGFDFGFLETSGLSATPAERRALWDELWARQGFAYLLENYHDIAADETFNLEVYEYWRDKTRARINNPRVAEMLAPTKPVHPFGVKRCPLENGYYEVYNQSNVDLIDLRTTNIKITPTSIVTDEAEHEVDLIVLATGFDAVSGAILGMDIRGRNNLTVKEYWKEGIRTQFGLNAAGFPNLFFLYGPQSPAAFWNGPTSAEYQGDILANLFEFMSDRGYSLCESTHQADADWAQLISDTVKDSLMTKADSWYMGANIPGKRRESLNFPGGGPLYLEKCKEAADSGYSGFEFS